jgi:hypothetical protein
MVEEKIPKGYLVPRLALQQFKDPRRRYLRDKVVHEPRK